ncbi:phage tail tape measure protein [Vibrio zhanjiangensis]|uniref:Phage tail tape measure protein n=1 Tax=Vibrio zhanjiangensis TaxID=1046128 RepID=A0ABQ6EYC6_9VIBR|nr:phage tail tape measure protein [Vibrio zhanjiangensis]GLT18051.1 phage tail tape measure protein [Vibrio zhanjiangensis]
MSLPEPLRFTVGLIDQISKPLGNIQRQFSSMASSYRDGTHTMVSGAAGVAGAGIALQQALMPAIEMDRALGEVKSLGVADAQLKNLAETALQFSVEYGKSASDFVAASYDIQSAIAGLAGNELSEFTRASGVLAAATKADTATITNYVGTMYGIFQNTANDMGKANWVNMLGGQTAKAVQIFKTTGSEMSSAFTSVGAAATSVGVGMTEQMAILGTLQSTMSGSEAGTKYRAFLAGAAKAQDTLNMSFTDSQGQLLPIVDILGKLKQRYGETISVAEAAELSKAFGSQEATAMVQLLMQNTDGLAGSIEQLGKVKGLDAAEQMAGAMTDQWERMEQGLYAIRAAIGTALLPSLLPMVQGLADGAMQLVEWTKLFPNITRYIGYATVAFFGLVAVGGLLTVVTGAFSMLMSPILLIVGGVGLAIGAVVGLIAYWDKVKEHFGDTAMFKALEHGVEMVKSSFVFLYQSVEPLFPLFKWIGTAIFEVMKVLSVVAVGVISKLITGGIQLISYVLTGIVSGVSLVIGVFSKLFQFLSAGWTLVTSGFTDLSGFDGLFAIVDEIKAYFGSMFDWVGNGFDKVISWIPGFGDDEAPGKTISAVQQATPKARVQQGGVARQMSTYNQGRSTNYGGVNIYPTYMNSPQDMANELEMAAP